MNSRNQKKYCVSLIGAAALAMASAPASAVDIRGFSTPGDFACAIDPVCALSRGGVSDGLLIVFGGNVIDSIIAFENEEANNFYYFDPASVPFDPAATGTPTFLVKPDGTSTFSDLFGVLTLGTLPTALGFISDPFLGLTGAVIPTGIVETPGVPFGLVMEPGTVPTIFYDATAYLHPDFRAAGITALFFSDYDVVPEIDAVAGTGALTLLAGSLAVAAERRKRAGKTAGVR